MFKTLLLASLLALLRAQEPPDPPTPDPPIIVPNCTTFDPSTSGDCLIQDMNYTISGANQTLEITYNGTIRLMNTLIYCNDTCTLENGTETERWQIPQYCCQLKINATGDVWIDINSSIQSNITNSYFKVNSIEIYAGGQIKISNYGTLSTAGMGNMYGLGYVTNETGASYAAQAGFTTTGQKNNLSSIYGTYYQNPDNCPIDFQYGSGSGSPNAIGGGRIILQARSFQIQGSIYSGGTPTSKVISTNGGGSGGYIYMKQIIDNPQPGENLTYGSVILKGNIKADGGGGINSGGSGGRIILDLYSLAFNSTIVDTKSKMISAQGGLPQYSIFQPPQFNQIGGPGTIFYGNESKLYIRGPDDSTQASLNSPVAVIHNLDDRDTSNYYSLQQLHINVQSLVTFKPSYLFKDTKVTVNNITLERNGYIVSNPNQTNSTIVIQAQNITMRENSQIYTKPTYQTVLNVTKNFINVSSTSSIDSGQYLDLICDQIYIYGKITTTANNPSTGKLIQSLSEQQIKRQTYSQALSFLTIIANTSINITNDFAQQSGTHIQADRLFFYSLGDINITSFIASQITSGTSTCSYDTDQELFSFVQGKQQIPLNQSVLLNNFGEQFNIDVSNMSQDLRQFRDLVSTNFTYTLIAMNRLKLLDPQTKIQTSRLGAYARLIEIDGTIDTSGQGCIGNDGLGRGRQPTLNCTGSGASHGGRGGRATAKNSNNTEKISRCSQFQSESYGTFDSFQAFEGSGGGVILDPTNPKLSSGGGYIWIQAGALNFTNQGSSLIANGNDGLADTFNGGGSGGSIVIAINQLQGSAILQANGGQSPTGQAGGGAGGRIKFYYFSWYDPSLQKMDQSMTIQSNGGFSQIWGQNLSGENGSIWRPPCAPGFYGLFCQACPRGTFKSEYSNVDCRPCQNMPPQAQAQNSAKYNESQQTMPMCKYQCLEGYIKVEDNPKCLSDIQLFYDNLGGLSIFIILILAAVFGIIIVIYTIYQRNKKKDDNFEIDENLNKLRLAFEELDFIQRDLYQHVCRIYLLGNNQINSPWIVPMIPPRALKDRINAERYQDFVQQINGCYKNSKMEIFFSKTLPILYPVLKPLMNKFKRKERYNAFKRAFISISDKMEFWKSVDDKLNIEVRFTASDDYNLGFIDFLDTKKTRDSFQKPPLPMTILVGGTGSFAKPFHITRHDPLTRAVNYCIEESSNLMWDMFLANLNSRLQAICIQNFGFLVRWRLLQVLSFINDYSKKLFERRGLKLNLYLLETNNYTSGPQENGQPVQLEEQYYVLNYEYLSKKRDNMNRLIQYWRFESFYNSSKVLKLALVITPLNHQVITASTPRASRQVSSNVATKNTDGNNLMSPKSMGQAFSQGIRAISQTLSKQNPHLSGETMVSTKTKIVTQTAYNSTNDNDYVQLLVGTVKIANIDQNKLKIFRDYRYGRIESRDDIDINQNGRNSLRDSLIESVDASNCQVITFYLKQTLMNLTALMKSISLRHSVVSRNFMIASICYMIFVFLDIISTSLLCVIIIQSSQTQTLLFFLLYPLANVLSPLLGVLSIMICKSFLYRASAYMNALSLYANSLALFIAFIVDASQGITLGQRVPYIIGMILTKLVLGQLLSVQIAYFRNTQYHVYQAKLQEHVEQADKEDAELKKHAIQMDMILEQNDDNNTAFGGGAAFKRSDVTPPSSLPEMVVPANGYSYGGGAQLYSPKGNNKYREPLIANKYDNNKSYIESDED